MNNPGLCARSKNIPTAYLSMASRRGRAKPRKGKGKGVAYKMGGDPDARGEGRRRGLKCGQI